MISQLEKRQTRISTNSTKLGSISHLHPFTHQVDVIFPSGCLELENVLSRLKAQDARGKVGLAQILAAGPNFVHPYVPLNREEDRTSSDHPQHTSSEILALSVKSVHDLLNDNVWCIDTRGVLTLCVDKETYERLGLVGQKLGFKHQSGERYVISLALHKNAESVKVQERRRSALESWDKSNIADTGPGTQGPPHSQRSTTEEIVYCLTEPFGDNSANRLEKWASQVPIVNPIIREITCEKANLENIWVPNPASLTQRPNPQHEEELEDWEHDVSTLFEWVGMAGLHAERLQVNDRVDPYIALYDPPNASKLGDVTHLRWRGLLSPAFVQAVIDTSITFLRSSTQSSSGSFVAIIAHGITNSPVVYLPPPHAKTKENRVPSPPPHLPRKEGEDTWCLVLVPTGGEEGKGGDVKNILCESVGQWDARWG